MTLKTAILALSSLGIIGTGGVVIYRNFRNTTVEQALQKETGLKILNDQSQSTEWEEIKTNNTESEKKAKLEGFIKKHNKLDAIQDDTLVEQLKKACKQVLAETPSETNINEAKVYCTKQVS